MRITTRTCVPTTCTDVTLPAGRPSTFTLEWLYRLIAFGKYAVSSTPSLPPPGPLHAASAEVTSSAASKIRVRRITANPPRRGSRGSRGCPARSCARRHRPRDRATARSDSPSAPGPRYVSARSTSSLRRSRMSIVGWRVSRIRSTSLRWPPRMPESWPTAVLVSRNPAAMSLRRRVMRSSTAWLWSSSATMVASFSDSVVEMLRRAVDQLAQLGVALGDGGAELVHALQQLGDLHLLALGDVGQLVDERVELRSVRRLDAARRHLRQLEHVERRARALDRDDAPVARHILEVRRIAPCPTVARTWPPAGWPARSRPACRWPTA